MHFEFLIEDLSGKKALEIMVKKIIDETHTWKIHSYKGIGRIPPGMREVNDPKKRMLLTQLPKLLNGYGKTFAGYPKTIQAAVIVVTDIDNRVFDKYIHELKNVLEKCSKKPRTEFCLAIEEGEAWFLGDLNAIKKAYPHIKMRILSNYKNDSICGTWEKLADAIYPGGSPKLKNNGWQFVGKIKSEWAEKISIHMDVDLNKSNSFCHFRDTVRNLAKI